jgi:hypothetical protein
MRGTRSLYRWVSGMLLVAILFTQLATAAHACPSMRVADRDEAASMASMPCAGSMADGAVLGMDPNQAALCLQHCQAGAQTVDTGHAPSMAAAAMFAVIVLTLGDDRSTDAPSWFAHARVRDRAPPPVHSILHCCWRI